MSNHKKKLRKKCQVEEIELLLCYKKRGSLIFNNCREQQRKFGKCIKFGTYDKKETDENKNKSIKES
eukprot:maker-scaffold_44-snap-gene-0.46-mRNA-1 protein AED:0.26 eAED:0.26 QI:47/1/1/1/0/0/2/154/66